MTLLSTSMVVDPSIQLPLDKLIQTFAEYKTFYLKPGNYEIYDQILINSDNIQIIGESGDPKDVHIFQKTLDKNGIVINADNITIKYISVHVETGGGISLTCKASDRTIVEYCHFYGNDNTFTVFYSGPELSSGIDTLNGYDNDILDSGNIFKNNIVYSKWSGDCVAFSLQKNGFVLNNLIRGGKLAIYMVKDVNVMHNYIYDSSAHGIFCSFPSKNIIMSYNTIRDCVSSAITCKMQLEHGEYTNSAIGIGNISITNNMIQDAGYIGIEVNNYKGKINNNNILWTKEVAIFINNSSDTEIINNVCSHFLRGIHVDINVTNLSINNNKLYSVYPENATFGVLIEPNTSNVVVMNNDISGQCTTDYIRNNGDNTIGNNTVKLYHNFYDEYINIL